MTDHLDHTLWKQPSTPEPVLKPCPFCGSNKVRILALTPEAWVRCDACLATGGDKRSMEEAVAAWNAATRTGENDAFKEREIGRLKSHIAAENDVLKARVAELEAALFPLVDPPPGFGVYGHDEHVYVKMRVGHIRYITKLLGK